MQVEIFTIFLISFATNTFGQGASTSYDRLVWQRQINIVKENEQRLLDYAAKQKAKSNSNTQLSQNNEVEVTATLQIDDEEEIEKEKANDLEKIKFENVVYVML